MRLPKQLELKSECHKYIIVFVLCMPHPSYQCINKAMKRVFQGNYQWYKHSKLRGVPSKEN